ncbi:MAG: hypothetical protein IAE77_18395 [Prosthecobacter sp.]|jgi:hypothetical protein|uniref:hypothetical protein n=1 Tax=Prosthecobacter sp. TaxID=1965333 RepID=UPI001A020CC5|nr:hypothetical protein [Prosthecobacter sp.]MBE2285438.1 hypothetical protein [Prosthecobacter sp.]
MMLRLLFRASALLLPVLLPVEMHADEKRVPIIYSTDLYHPPSDPDDHFDTAVLFAMREFDVRCVVLDNGLGRQVEPEVKAEFRHRIGRPPLEQLMHITGRQVKYGPGLPTKLTSATDKGLQQPAENQASIDMMLGELRASEEKVTLFLNGSCRDFAAAFNRDPELFRQKVKAIYCNAGIVVEKGVASQIDYNVELDPVAFFRLFETGVPLYWCSTRPKMSERAPGGPYSTNFWIHEQRIIRAGSLPVQNYFIYCLTGSKEPHLPFLAKEQQKIPTPRGIAGDGGRFIWCTAPFVHAAGRSIYRKGIADFHALQPAEAERLGLAGAKIDLFTFVPASVKTKEPLKSLEIDVKSAAPDSPVQVFHRPVTDTDYRSVMESVLANLAAELGK